MNDDILIGMFIVTSLMYYLLFIWYDYHTKETFEKFKVECECILDNFEEDIKNCKKIQDDYNLLLYNYNNLIEEINIERIKSYNLSNYIKSMHKFSNN